MKPEFWGHPKIARLSRDARLLFLGLLNESDDEGRQLASPRRIAGAVFPNDEDVTTSMLEAWLSELERERMILRYEVNEQRLLCIVGFDEHQKVTHPSKSHLPPPPTCTLEGLPRLSGESPASLTPDLGSRIVGSRKRSEASEGESLPRTSGDPACPQCQGRGVKGYALVGEKEKAHGVDVPCDCTLEGYEPRPEQAKPPAWVGSFGRETR